MGSVISGPRNSPICIGLVVPILFTGILVTPWPAPGQAVHDEPRPDAFWVYVGASGTGGGTNARSGIHLFELDARSGTVVVGLGDDEAAGLRTARSGPRVAAELNNPSSLAIHPTRRFLYAANQQDDSGGKPGGRVSAFSIDSRTGTLASLDQESSEGDGPCHLVVDRSGKNVLVAHCGSGSIACLPIDAEGRLRPASSFTHHRGSGSNPGRKRGPHAQSIHLDAANRFAVVTDLGLDRVLIYRFDAERGQLTANSPAFTQLAAGSGPRRFAFHPNGRSGYVINELANSVTAFAYDAGKGSLTEIQTVSTLPADFHGRSSAAEVHVHDSGRFLFASNRGHDSIVIFSIDSTSGKLATLGFAPTRGKTPGDFALDPTGSYLLAANQGSDTIAVFRIDQRSGALRPWGSTHHVSSPACIQVISKPSGMAK
jgi:6-phosphogluconolactonase